MALEARLMFDGAAVAEAAHAALNEAAHAALNEAAHAALSEAQKALIPVAAAPAVVREADPAKDGGRTEVAFVDTSVAGYKTLEAGIKDGVAIVEIGGGDDGLAQMAQWAETHAGYDAIHVFSHGAEGTIVLGTGVLSGATLSDAVVQAELAGIGTALKPGGDLLVYGCDVAAGNLGQAFVSALAGATGADVAASDDPTGNAARGGDWVMEYQAGAIETQTLQVDEFLDVLGLYGKTVDVQVYDGTQWLDVVTGAAVGDGDEFNDGSYVVDVTDTGITLTYPDQCGTVQIYSVRFTFSGGNIASIDSVGAPDLTNLKAQPVSGPAVDLSTVVTLDAGSAVGSISGLTVTMAAVTPTLDNTSYSYIGTINYAVACSDLPTSTTTYTSTNTTFTTANGSRVAVGDFDADGDTDILYQYDTTPGHVGYAENQGNGTFITIEDSDGTLDQQMSNGHYTPFRNITLGNVGTGSTQYCADFDGDGDTDIFEATNGQTSRFLRNDGGVYVVQSVPSWSGTPIYSRVRVGDFDNDGDPDILFQEGNTAGTISYARNDGNFTFTITTTTDGILAGTPFAGITLTQINATPYHYITDIDGDGDVDLLECETSIKILRNDAGSFVDAGSISGISFTNGSRIRVADFDGDGDADILYQPLAGTANSVGYARNNGDGTFTITTDTDGTLDGTPFANITYPNIGLAPYMYLGDFDGDGDVDILKAINASTAVIDFQSGSPPRIQSATPGNRATGVATNADIVLTMTENVTAGAGNIRIYKSDGTLFETIAANDTAKVTVSGAQVTINPSGTFDNSTKYYLLFDKDSLKDSDGMVFGYFDPTYNMVYSGKNPNLYSFTTLAAPASPTIASAAYDGQTGVLTITGTGMTAGDSIDPTKFTFTGTGGTYTLAGTYSVTASSATAAAFTLSAADRAGVDALLDRNGTAGSGGTTYDIAAAANWDSTASAAADATGNTLTVSGVPTLTSATYDAGTGVLTVTGSNIEAKPGGGNDIAVGKLTLTGEGGNSYTLTSSDVERTSASSFSVTLNATDRAHVNGLLNTDGPTSLTSGTTFNLAAADDWNANHTAGNTAVATVGITVGNISGALPTITSATYDQTTHVLTVTGTNMVHLSGAANDITLGKLTLTGENGTTRTLTSPDVEITSATSFSVTLNATDQAAIEPYLNKAGTASTGGTTYNLAAADDWNGPIGDVGIADATNAVTVTVAAPAITGATYDEGTGVLTVTGTGLMIKNGATNDIDPTKLTLTGEGGNTYTLTSPGVEITDSTHFAITLNAADKLALNGLLNKSGAQAGDATPFNIAGAAGWNAGEFAASADLTGNGVTVSNLQAPAVSGITYDPSTGLLVISGTNFVPKAGAANDVDVTKFTFTGQGGGTRALSTSSSVEITSATSIAVTLSGADKAAVDALFDQNGTQSSGGTPYNLALATGWLAALSDSDVGSAAASNAVTVSIAPTITSATYDETTGALVVTGTNLQALAGAANDIDATKITLTGKNGGTYTLTAATGNVEIGSATSFTLMVTGADKAAVDALLDRNGATSSDSTTYSIVAAANWNAGYSAGGAADSTGNGITVSHAPAAIAGASYDTATGVLSVSAVNMGVGDTIDASKLTLKGQGAATYTLAGSYTVTSSSTTAFQITLTGADKTNADALFSVNGTTADDSTTYNVAAAANWDSTAGAAADLTGNAVTVAGNPGPTITSATYDAATGVLVVTADHLSALAGAANDVDVSKLTLTGEDGATYTLTTTSVERDSLTRFTVTLNAADKAAVNQILNKAGTSSTGDTTFNIAAAAGWSGAASGAADATSAVTVSNPDTPTITSATYDAGTGTLVVTGTGLLKKSGAANDIDVGKFTITGEGGETHTLTTSGVEITNGTSFTIVLSAADRSAIDMILNKDGTSSTGAGTYNLAAAEDWAAGAEAAVEVADLTGNAIAVSNVAAPTVTGATYDYGTGVLTVTGTGLLKRGGAANDIDLSKLTLSGKANGTYTLTSTDVEIAGPTGFTVTLNAADRAAVNLLLDANGTTSGSVTYNLAAGGGWNRGSAIAAADTTGNGVTVSGVPAPVADTTTANNNSSSGSRGNADTGTTDKGKTGTVGDGGDKGADSLRTVVRTTDTASGTGTGTTGFGPTVITSLGITSITTPAAAMATVPSGDAGQTARNDGGAAQSRTTTVTVIPNAVTLAAPNAFQVVVAAKAAGAADALVVNSPIKDTAVAEGAKIVVSIPADTFASTRADATVTLTATRVDGAALPGWMAFNPQTGTFEGTPPPGFKGEVVVRVIARDQDGRQAVQTFKISVGGAGQGRVAPSGERGQGQPQGEGQPSREAPGRQGDAGGHARTAGSRPEGRPSLTEQLRSMSMKGRVAQQAALFEAFKNGGEAA